HLGAGGDRPAGSASRASVSRYPQLRGRAKYMVEAAICGFNERWPGIGAVDLVAGPGGRQSLPARKGTAMTFMDKTRCRAVVTVARALAPWNFPRYDKWGKQDVVVFKFLPGIDAVLMPVHGKWIVGGATTSGEAISDWLPSSLGVTTSDGGQVVAGTALSALMGRYHAIATDEDQPEEARSAAAAGFHALGSLG